MRALGELKEFFIPERKSFSNVFAINWRGNLREWIFHNPGDLPIDASLDAIIQVMNMGGGTGFFLPSLAEACNLPKIKKSWVGKSVILKFQEGSDSGIFRVTAKVTTPILGQRTLTFCINCSKNPRNNHLHETIFRNLQYLRTIDNRFVVRPFRIADGNITHKDKRTKLTVLSTEWLDGYTEINMFNAAEPGYTRGYFLSGRAKPSGRNRKLYINNVNSKKFRRGIVDDKRLEAAIAEEMVKILTVYFNPETGEHLADFCINAGDFVYKPNSDGTPSLKLITARKISRFSTANKNFPHLNACPFIHELLYRMENSVNYQDSLHDEYETYFILTFKPIDVCKGIKKALVDKFGEIKGKGMLLKWLVAYLFYRGLLPQHKNRTSSRDQEIKEGFRFFLEQEYSVEQISQCIREIESEAVILTLSHVKLKSEQNRVKF